MDTLTKEHRSWNMSRIGPRNTRPEMLVRQLLYRLGYRYRLHHKDLIGKPDIVFVSRRKVIFVHGCFWHRHPGCKMAYSPKSKQDFWNKKFESNVMRDKQVQTHLNEQGWDIMVVWECETQHSDSLSTRLKDFLTHQNHLA